LTRAEADFSASGAFGVLQVAQVFVSIGREMDACFFLRDNATRMADIADIIDLSLLTDARRYLHKMLDKRGLSYFLQKDGPRLFHLEPSKVDLVVRTALRTRNPELPPPHERAVEHCRKEVRRELIRRVAGAMLQTGL
jgi:hypothetical protein